MIIILQFLNKNKLKISSVYFCNLSIVPIFKLLIKLRRHIKKKKRFLNLKHQRNKLFDINKNKNTKRL